MPDLTSKDTLIPSAPPQSGRGSRKAQILQALADMLEAVPGGRITTAALAREVGVSEAALYRHFPSKARMFEGLIGFIEESLFSRIAAIEQSESSSVSQCQQILLMTLVFCERNPGVTRILTGDAITGENERLHQQVVQLFDRLEAQIRATLRKVEQQERLRTRIPVADAANLMLALVEGKISQFVRSGFKRPPTEYWESHWRLTMHQVFVEVVSKEALAPV